ncbi:MAG: sulfate reduction electron transfer complex DsrMKJOP subunit DsrJ [Chlorobiales bacterium]|nr:sulfate reduction electron transfer complex DsrMKJOP subunit DsrJ [Chlorobiales bacterium]
MEAQKTPEPERAPHQGYTKKMLQQLLSIQKQDVPIDSSQCIAPKEFIRANHMRILNEWRNSSVREGNRVYVAHNGSKFEKSLNTCIGCHNNTFFCYYCHDYADVKPTCWNCHLSPLDSQK